VRDRNMNDASRSELRIGATLEAVSILSEVGRDQKAIGLLESDLSLAHRMGQPADLAREELALATIRNADGDRAGAREAATAALDLEPGSDILRAAGPLLVVAGGQEAATARMHAFDAKVPLGEARTWRVTRIPHLMIEGELLLARGQARAGVRKLREAADIEEPGEPHAVLAEALESTGDRESALEEWLRIVESYRLLWASAQYAPPAGLGRRALERAVKLCQLSGNSAGTEARCERARQRLASLRTISVPN
jgi:tetratricopeptide (TPR) repeat protein